MERERNREPSLCVYYGVCVCTVDNALVFIQCDLWNDYENITMMLVMAGGVMDPNHLVVWFLRGLPVGQSARRRGQ